jgi:hypothetical protein
MIIGSISPLRRPDCSPVLLTCAVEGGDPAVTDLRHAKSIRHAAASEIGDIRVDHGSDRRFHFRVGEYACTRLLSGGHGLRCDVLGTGARVSLYSGWLLATPHVHRRPESPPASSVAGGRDVR